MASWHSRLAVPVRGQWAKMLCFNTTQGENMKRYILSGLFVLALTTPHAYAENDSTPSAPANAPYSGTPMYPGMMPPGPPMGPGGMQPFGNDESYQEIMAERNRHMQAMQEYQQKISQASDPAEREKLMQEYQQAMEAHMEKMRSLGMPGRGRGMMGPGGYGPMGGPGRHMKGPGHKMGRHGMGRGYQCPHREEKMQRLKNIENMLQEILEHIRAEDKNKQ